MAALLLGMFALNLEMIGLEIAFEMAAKKRIDTLVCVASYRHKAS